MTDKTLRRLGALLILLGLSCLWFAVMSGLVAANLLQVGLVLFVLAIGALLLTCGIWLRREIKRNPWP